MIGWTVITGNTVAYVSGTAVNVTEYVNILISVIMGVYNIGCGDWYILLTMIIRILLITFTQALFMASFKFWYGKI